jgi:6-hydroxymethylpterin diphosphokinase MptE-like protein/flagellin glycosyltransferase Maf-like protein
MNVDKTTLLDKSVQRHEEAFQGAFPKAYSKIAAVRGHHFPVIVRDGEAINIQVGDDNLYPAKSKDWAQQQIEAYCASPDRILFPDIMNFLPSGPLLRALQGVGRYFMARPDLKGASGPVVDSGFFFVFGVGLGDIVPLILERFPVRHIVLVEPEAEIAHHAMRAQPWADILATCERKNIRISFLIADDKDRFVEDFYNLMPVEPNVWFVEGSYALVHYATQATVLLRHLVNERIKVFLRSSGQFQDEIVMTQNALGNFQNNKFRLLFRPSSDSDPTPVFLIGSGPSLDKDMDDLRRLRDHAIYVACGSALSVLLRNGIKPDVFVETENLEIVTEVFEKWSRQYDLTGIQLLGATNLQPESLRYFEDPVLFVRPSLSSTLLANFGADEVEYGAPIVGNAAFSAMATLGFRNFYFFGMDCGAAEPERHHAADAIYFEEGLEHLPVETDYDIEVPGNFGGTFRSTPLLDFARQHFLPAIAYYGCTVTNCSDGAVIDFAQPVRASQIELPLLQRPTGSIFKERSECWRTMTPELARGEWPDSPSLEHCRTFMETFEGILEGFDFTAGGIWDLAQALHSQFDRQSGGVLPLIWYSVAIQIRLGAFYGNRIVDAGERAEFMHAYTAIMVETTKDMIETIAEEICALTERGRVA